MLVLLHKSNIVSFRAEKFVSTNFAVEKSCCSDFNDKISPLRSLLTSVEMTQSSIHATMPFMFGIISLCFLCSLWLIFTSLELQSLPALKALFVRHFPCLLRRLCYLLIHHHPELTQNAPAGDSLRASARASIAPHNRNRN